MTAGPIEGFLRTARSRVMTPADARPHHFRLVLLMVMSLSPFALAGKQFLLEFVRDLGVLYDPPAASTVRDVLLDIFFFVTDQLRAEIKRLQARYRGLPLLHLVTDLWTERNGTGSYGSLVLRCVNSDGLSIFDLHLGVVPFSGRHDHINNQAWTSRFLRRFGVRIVVPQIFRHSGGINSRLFHDGKLGADPHQKDDLKFLKSFKLNMNTPKFEKNILKLAGCEKSGGTLQTPPSFTIRLRDPSAPLLDPPLWKIPLPEMRILQGETSGNPPPPLKRSEIRIHAVDFLPRVHRTTVSKTLRITFEGPFGHAVRLLPLTPSGILLRGVHNSMRNPERRETKRNRL